MLLNMERLKESDGLFYNVIKSEGIAHHMFNVIYI